MSTSRHRSARAVPIILTRWMLLISISYAIIFSSSTPAPVWPHQVFIAALLASNLLFTWLLARARSWAAVSGWAAGIDIATVSMAISVAGNISFEFYIVFFLVLILTAVVTGRELLVALSLVACLAYGALMWADLGSEFWRSPGVLCRRRDASSNDRPTSSTSSARRRSRRSPR